MCGISGFIDFSGKTDLCILEKMNRTMSHRGPDGEGYAVFTTNDATVGMGHRRLSIIDLSDGGKQPKSYKHYHITFNGEIYNYVEIKKLLEDKGHQFSSHSDTEVVLHAFEEWGVHAVDRFIGMFAFVIYDERQEKLTAFRDRAGVKPFFYFWKDGLFLFASELKAILQHPSFVKNINLDAAAAYMQYGYVPTPHCIFNNTHKLGPGYYLNIDLAKKEISTSQYWNVYDSYNKSILKIDFPEAVEETEKLLTSAFKYRMVSDVPVGVFLSGGFDSSCVTAMLQKNSTEKIKTFTIGVPDAGLNEAAFAKDIARHLGTDHTEYYCTEKEALEIVPQLPFFYDEPFADSSAIPTSLVSKIAKEKVTVALSADAGDEIFAGYTRYDYILKYGQKIQRVPKFLRNGMASLMSKIPSGNFSKNPLFNNRYEKVKSLFKNPSEKNILSSWVQEMNDNDINKIFKENIIRLPSGFDSEELKNSDHNILSYSMAVDYQTYLLDDILQKVDRATMSVSLEGREPFLDQRIIEWAARLPLEYKYNKGVKKFILKEIVYKYIPKEMIDRPKMGFGVPMSNWLKNDLKQFVDYFLDENYIKQQNIFNEGEIARIKKEFYGSQGGKAGKIWYLLMFQMWYDKWMK